MKGFDPRKDSVFKSGEILKYEKRTSENTSEIGIVPRRSKYTTSYTTRTVFTSFQANI